MDFTTVAVVGAHFEKKRATAMGVVFAGSGFGSLILAPLIGWLNEFYGFWKGSMLIIAGLLLNCVPLSLLYSGKDAMGPQQSTAESVDVVVTKSGVSPFSSKKNTQEVKNAPSQDKISSTAQTDDTDPPAANSGTLGSHQEQLIENAIPLGLSSLVYQEQSRCATFTETIKDMMDLTLLTNYVFLIFNVAILTIYLGIRMPFVYIPHLATELGLATERNSSYLIAIVGVSNTFGRLILGAWADKTSLSRLSIFNGILMLNGLSNIAIPFVNHYYLLAIYCCVFGATYGDNFFFNIFVLNLIDCKCNQGTNVQN